MKLAGIQGRETHAGLLLVSLYAGQNRLCCIFLEVIVI